MTEPWLTDILAARDKGDEYVEVTTFGDADPQHLLARDAKAAAVALARAKYVDGSITIEQFEHAFDLIHETLR